jgi:hypothetical protein
MKIGIGLLGFLLLISPVIALFIVCVRDFGWRDTLQRFSIAALMVVAVCLGAILIVSAF